ncbi:MAG: hypothetical protein FRX49_05051 [Trebouxia sp. A1-2]|nr:MAG: hypothetical protein FRX49_05051 [Trebouxia sp. A1-2]
MGAQISQDRVNESRMYNNRQWEQGQGGVRTRNGLVGLAEHALLPPDYPLTFRGPAWRMCVSQEGYYGDPEQLKSKNESEQQELYRQQGKCPLSASDMLLLGGTRQHLHAALDHARLMDKNEELLLHVFGNKLPSGYELGLYKDLSSGSSTLKLAVAQSETLLKMCPEHFVGRIGQVVGKLCCGATKEASALLKPRPQVLGPLGIVHLLQGVTNAILKFEAKQEQAEAELMELNKEALKQLAEKEKPVRAHIAGVQKALLKGYERVLGEEPSRQETSFSLRAIGCFQAGLHQQTIDICAEWLKHVGKDGHAVWATVLTAYAQLHLAERPRKLRQVAEDLVLVTKLVAEHPEVQLASIALPGLPSDIKGYVTGVETVVCGVRCIADAWDSAISSDNMVMPARLDESAAAPSLSQAGLAALLEDGVTGCTTMLTSPHAALSMAATSRMFYLRARFYTRQREISYALTDLAFAHSLNPLDAEVLQLWGSILSRLGAINAARELLDLTHFALDHHPRKAQDYIARAKIEDWTYQQSCYLPRKGTFMPGHDPDRKLSLADYRLLCNNQLGVKAHGIRVNRMVKQTFTKWCDAFGRHAGLEMPQVAHLVEEAVQAQVVLMSENRRDIHRDAKAGPDFGSVVYGSTQQALAFIPPADPLPAPAAASGHAAGTSGTGASFASGAYQTGSTPSGSAPFTRQGSAHTTPRARPQNRGFRRPFSRSGTAGPSEDTSETASSAEANKWSRAKGESSGSAQTQPQTQAETPAAAAATKFSSGGSPFTFSRTHGTAEGPPAAEAAMPAPPTGKPAGSSPAFGTPGPPSATPMAGASAPPEGTTTAPTPKEAFKWSGGFATPTTGTSSGGPAVADAAAGPPPSAPRAAAAGTGNSAPTFPTVEDWSPPPDTGKTPAFGTPGWSSASAAAGGAAKVPVFGTREWAASLGTATPSAQGRQSAAASFGTKGWTFSSVSKAPSADSSSTASASAAEPAAEAAAAPSTGWAPAAPFAAPFAMPTKAEPGAPPAAASFFGYGSAATKPPRPEAPKSTWPDQTPGSSDSPAPGSFNLGAFRPGDNGNAGGAAAPGASKFVFGQKVSQV